MPRNILPERKRKFAEAIAQGKSGARAAIEAGYKEKTARSKAHGLLKEQAVIEEVQRVHKTVADKLGINEEFVLVGLKTLTDDPDAKIRLQAYNSLAKHLNLMTQKIDMAIHTQDDFVKSLCTQALNHQNDQV